MGWEALVSRTPTEIESRTAFVEVAGSGPDYLTYSSLLNDELCADIDRRAYAAARGWYLDHGTDHTDVDGVSLGRAFELPATVTLVRLLRAKAVLRAIAGRGPIALAGVGDEWDHAARELGLAVIRLAAEAGPRAWVVPDPAVAPPERSRRLAARLASAMPSARSIAFLGSPAWARPYRQALPAGDLEVINPGKRAVLDALTSRRRPRFSWLADSLEAAPAVGYVSDETASLRALFDAASARMAALAVAPAVRRRRVLIATEDVSPSARIAALATLAAGGRVLTLEHGITGGYREQVHSVATVLGTWGESQARYHRLAGAPGQTVITIGWPRLATQRLAPIRQARYDVVYFGQPVPSLSAANWPEDAINAARTVGSYAGRHPTRRVAWKPHPASDAYGGAFEPGPQVRRVAGESLDLIAQAHIVAVTRSTTALEAMALGRPVIQLVGRGHAGGPDFVAESGAVSRVASVEEFEHVAERLLGDPAARRRAVDAGRAYLGAFISGFASAGQAERRLVELVTDLAAEIG